MINNKIEEVFSLVSDNYKKAIQLIEQEKLDVNCFSESGYTLLFIAVCSKKYEMVKYLLEKGANPNQESINGGTPLGFIVGEDSENTNVIRILKELVSYGADLNDTTDGELQMTMAEMIGMFMGEDILNQVLACVNTKVSRSNPSDEIVKVNLLNDVMLTVKLLNNTTAKDETLNNLDDYFTYLLDNRADVVGFYRNKGDLLEVSIGSENYDVCYICKNDNGKYDGHNLALSEPINIEMAKKVAELFIKSDDGDFLLIAEKEMNASVKDVVKDLYIGI